MVKPLNAFSQEFAMKYQNTVMKVTDLLKDKEAYGVVSGDCNSVHFQSFYPSQLASFDERSLLGLKLEVFLPKEGYYSSGKHTFFLERVSHKQWNNSFGGGLYKAYLLKTLGERQAHSTNHHNLVEAILHPKYIQYEKGVQVAGKKKLPLAISRELCIDVREDGSAVLKYLNCTLGKATPEGVVMGKSTSVMKEFMYHNNIPVA